MKRHFRILALQFVYAFELRSRSFVWFLVALFNPILLLVYWKAVFSQHGGAFGGLGDAQITSYYLLLVIIGAMLEAHIEEDVGKVDIQQGGLVRYLLKPFSYLEYQFLSEIPWRVIQGSFGLLVLLCILFFTNIPLALSHTTSVIFMGIIVGLLGFGVSFMFKMILGILAFWFTDYSGLATLIEIITLIFAGFLMPIEFFPSVVHMIAVYLPFAYVIYFPIRVIQGVVLMNDIVNIVLMQIMWIVVFFITYKVLWLRGVKKFTGIGQ